MKKSSLPLIFLILFFPLFFEHGLTLPTQGRPIIKVGLLGPLSIDPGIDMEKGVLLAIEEININGISVNGTVYDLELIAETTSGPIGLPDLTVGSASLAKLQNADNVVAIIGGYDHNVVLQLQNELVETPFLGIGEAFPISSEFFFRVGSVNGSRLAHTIAEYYGVVMNELGTKNITVVREDVIWSSALSNGIKGIIDVTYQQQGYINNFTWTEDLVISESAIASQVESTLAGVDKNVNTLLTLFTGSVGGLVTNAWAKLDMDQYLAGLNVESQKRNFFTESTGAAYGEIEIETTPPDKNLTTKSGPFRTAFWDKYHESPSIISHHAYDATYILVEALKTSNSVDNGTLVQNTLIDTDYVGTAGRYKFTSESNQTITPTGIFTTVHDLFTPLTYGIHSGEFIGGKFVQWQKNGEKITVWGYNSFVEDLIALQAGLPKLLRAPINHSNFGVIPTSSSISSSSSIISSSTISSSTTSIFTTSSSTTSNRSTSPTTTTSTPSLGSLLAIIGIIFLISNRKRK
jgi:ABC-type branched-subunit amino acid transport system substrate-binding protein